MSQRSIESTDQQCGEALLQARAEIWEAAARGNAELILHTALCHALARTRSSTALITLPASAAGPLRPAAEALVDGDGRVCCTVLQDTDNAPAGEATDALARCRRQSLRAAELGAPVGLPAADGDETQPRTLAVPLLRTRAVAGVLAVADKPARYLGAEAELLRGLAAMAADGLDALRDRSALRAGDVTALRETEADLRAARISLDVALEAASLGLYEVDLVTGKAEVDDRYLGQLGLSREEAINVERWTDLIHPDDRERLQAATSDALSGRAEQLDTEYRMRHADGGWRWLLDRWQVYARDEAGAQLRVAGVHLDITERKQAEERLAALNRSLEAEVATRTAEVQRQAEQLRALASRLTRTEQHERRRLATILHDHIQQLIVAAQIQVSRMRRADDPTRLRGAAEDADRSLAEALTASRSLAVELSPPVLHEHGLIGGLNWLVNRMREQHRLAVRLRADTSAEPADDDWHVLLFECVRELLLNIVKHAGVEHAEVTLTRSGTDALRLSVADAGAGFDPTALAAVRPEEMSFGLFSIQQRLTHMGGHMELQSAPDRGTRVDLVVPAAKHAKATAAPAAVAAAAAPAAIEVRRRPRSWGVLIVDDHHIMREGLAGLLQVEPDLNVVGEAADGEQAITLAAELAPDVIIMDVNLGAGVDGIEVTRRVLAAHPDITIIGLSMHEDQDTADAMREAGAAAYLTKGGPPEDLIGAIRRHGPR